MGKPIRILSISHACVVSAYRMRQAEVARHEGISLSLLTPENWNQFNTPCHAASGDPSHKYRLILKQPFSFGLKNHGLRNASHIYMGLEQIICEAEPDILELWEEPFFAVAWQAIRLFRRHVPGGPIIFFSAQNVKKWRPPPFSWFEKYAMAESQLCFAMNREVDVVLREKGWRGRTEILPLGINPSDYVQAEEPSREAMRGKLGFRGVVIAFLGKLDNQKGILDLIEAVSGLSGGPEITLAIAGAGPLREELADRLKSFPVNSRLMPSIPHCDVPAWLGATDIVVMPSRTMPRLKEQFGRVAVEGMAAGKAVVVSSSGELPNVVGGDGKVFPEGDIPALRSVLKELVENQKLREELGRSARAAVIEKYSWEVIANRQVKIYRELLAT